MQTRHLSELRPHPENARIYGDGPDPDLVESVRARGIYEPLVVTTDNVIVSGYRRWSAAREAGRDVVPVTVLASDDDLDVLEALVHCNKQRIKTRHQLACEAEVLLRVERERAQRRQQEGRKAGGKARHGSLPEPVPASRMTGEARDRVGEALGVSGRTAERAARVAGEIRKAEESGNTERAQKLRDTLDTRGIGPAFRESVAKPPPTTAPAGRVLKGVVQVFGRGDHRREYIVVTLPYGKARLLFTPDRYRVSDGQGEQRGIVHAHARKLRTAIEEGEFTPTAIHVGLRPRHAQALKFEEVKAGRIAVLPVQEGDTLPLTDGGHRMYALGQIRADAEAALQEARTDDDKQRARADLEWVDAQPVTAFVHLNGSTQEDFLNLQQGKPVDRSHVLALRVRRPRPSDRDGPATELAFRVARLLHANDQSPFRKLIRFADTSHAPYPVATLCPAGPSDLGTSLLGLARVGLAADEPMAAEQLADAVIAAINVVAEEAPDLTRLGMVLTPPPDADRNGVTMLVGLGVALAYRMLVNGTGRASEPDLAQLVRAAREALDHHVSEKRGLSGPTKRLLLGSFVREFFADMTRLKKHEGLPVGLLRLLSPSAFGAGRLPRAVPDEEPVA